MFINQIKKMNNVWNNSPLENQITVTDLLKANEAIAIAPIKTEV